MKDQNIRTTPDSRRKYEILETLVRERVQGFIQGILEEEVNDFLGRGRSERRLEKIDVEMGVKS